MALGDFLAKFGTSTASPEDETPEQETSRAGGTPTREDLGAALDRVESMVTGGAVPGCVSARVERVTHVVRDTIPRLDTIRGSTSAYSVMATATDYLPEAVGGYLRLPRRFADTRPVDQGRTSLMVLVDQLDLLGATMDQVFDAVCRDDATALVAHGRFLTEKFGQGANGGDLEVDHSLPTPPLPDPASTATAAQDPPQPAATTSADQPPSPLHRGPANDQSSPPTATTPDEPRRLAPPTWT
ncbi:hypothetical protein [Austwickia sp. TVS 96-490-7B]|uniref:hypothetical protein n=1 Tax=Austwickia sp. TVS 96-490-7B TaxID=2830843 RepID=UPI001C5646FE|nr:hypothetical protein [Austwickia sp. TVS 96-490-7B]